MANFNTGPYFDDFDPEKNFYRVLFKPGYAVQARELNQLQSILQHQVTSVGNHLFKKNSMVVPGSVVLNNKADIVYVTGIDDPTTLIGKTISNATNPDIVHSPTPFITAVVLAALPARTIGIESIDAALYVKYFNSQTTISDGKTVTRSSFNKNEVLITVEPNYESFSVVNADTPTAVGKAVTISKGTFFTKDVFVDVNPQTLIIETEDRITNAVIGLQVVESFVTSDDDESLLDNANGSPNQYAPGADRYKIDLILSKADLDVFQETVQLADENPNFITMMRIENNVVTYLNDKTQYAELMKVLAQRMFDANGNFIVEGLTASLANSADESKLLANVSRGRCYLGGYEYDQISNLSIPIEKPRESDIARITSSTTRNLPYFYVGLSTANSLLNIPLSADSLVPLWDFDYTQIIGYCNFKYIEFVEGVVGNSIFDNNPPVYKLYFDELSMKKGYDISLVGGIGYSYDNVTAGASVLRRYTLDNLNIATEDGTLTPLHPILSPNDFRTGKMIGLNYGDVRGTNTLYVIKESASQSDLPLGETFVKDPAKLTNLAFNWGNNEGTATILNIDVSNYTPDFIPMIKVDDSTFKTVSNVKAIVPESQFFDNIGHGNGSDDFYVDSFKWPDGIRYKTSEFAVFRTDSVLTGDPYTSLRPVTWRKGSHATNDVDVVIDNNDEYYTIYIHSSKLPIVGHKYGILVTAKKLIKTTDSDAAIVKYLDSGNTIIPTPSKSWMTLNKQNVASINKIVEGRTYEVQEVASTSNGTNYTSTFTIPTPTNNLSTGNKVVVKNVTTSGTVAAWTTGTSYNVGDLVRSVGFDKVERVFYCKQDHDWSGTGTTSWPYAGLSWESYWIKIGVYDGSKGKLDNIIGSLTENPGGGVTTITFKIDTDIPLDSFNIDNALVAVPPNLTTDTDITTKYAFDGGANDSVISNGMIKLNKNSVEPVGQIYVDYSYYGMDPVYFEDTETPNVTFVSVDSYGDYNTDGLSYIGQIPNLTTPPIDAKRYIDYRCRASSLFFKNYGVKRPIHFNTTDTVNIVLEDLNLTSIQDSLVGKYVAGPIPGTFEIMSAKYDDVTGNTILEIYRSGSQVKGSNYAEGTWYIGFDSGETNQLNITGTDGLSIPFPADDQLYKVTYVPFKPAQLLLYLDRQEDLLTFKYMDVTSVNEAAKYKRDATKLPIAYIYLKPYCASINDATIINFKHPVYQMVDIDDLKKRIERNEYYVSKALSPSLPEEVEDTNSNRGFWNENFDDTSSHDYSSEDFACTIYQNSYVAPSTSIQHIKLKLNSTNSSKYATIGPAVTLKYNERQAFGNSAASRFNNLNPFNTIHWEGKMTLMPPVNNSFTVIVPKSEPPVVPPSLPPDVLPPKPPEAIEQPGGGYGLQFPSSLTPDTKPYTPPKVIGSDPPTTKPNDPPSEKPPVIPSPDKTPEIVTEVYNIVRAKGCSIESNSKKHSISFNWKTNKGTTGRVNTDIHLSAILKELGVKATEPDYALSMINKRYNNPKVKAYLHAGTEFDLKSPEKWRQDGPTKLIRQHRSD